MIFKTVVEPIDIKQVLGKLKMKAFALVPNVISRDPSFREVKAHMDKNGMIPLREEEATEKHVMAIYLGGKNPRWDGSDLLWEQPAFTSGYHYPIE